MNVLLVEPQKKKSWGKNNQYVGLLRIATYHQEQGDEVEYVVAPTMPRLKPDLVYITSMFTYWYDMVYEAVRLYKQMYPLSKVLLGGIYATLCPDHAKQSGADEVMVGQHTEAKEYPPNPDVLPYPQDFAYLFTSYGCNRTCTYCATHLLYGAGIRLVPAKKVVKDIRFLLSRGYRKIYIGDDNLLYDSANHIDRICEEIIANKLRVEIHIPGGMSAKDFTQKTAYLMRGAGVKEISFAIESTSEEVLARMGRKDNVKQEDLLRALEYSDKAGFKRQDINTYFIVGLPYQEVEDMVDTLIFLIDCGVWVHPQRLTPIPNTVDWKRMGLEDMDYLDLHYKEFVAPGQSNFTGNDLEQIYKIARFFNIATRYTSGYDWIKNKEIIPTLFRQKLLEGISQ